MLLAPFRPGAAHVMIFGPVFAARAVPGRPQKRQQGPSGTAQKGNRDGCGGGKLTHVMLRTKGGFEFGGPDRLRDHRVRSVGRDWRVSQFSFGRSKRMPRSSSSRSMRRSFAL